MKGLSAPKIEGKQSLRKSVTAEIVMEDIEVGDDALLPNVSGLKGKASGSVAKFHGWFLFRPGRGISFCKELHAGTLHGH
jgi:hypothetical protein